MADPQDKTTREVCDDLGVNYAELMKLYRGERDRIPVRRTGIGYLWSPEAVSIMRRILADQSDKRSALRQTEEAENYFSALSELRRAGQDIRRLGVSLLAVHEALKKNPPTATGFLHSLPDDELCLVNPLGVLLSPTDRGKWKATLAEAGLEALGETREKALLELREMLVRTYKRLRASPRADPGLWQALVQLIRPKRTRPWLVRSRKAETPAEEEEGIRHEEN